MPVGIAVSPAKQTLPTGKTTVLATVRNSGTATETVHIRPELVRQTGTHGCGVSPSSWATISPSTVTLAPGASAPVSIHVAIPGNVNGVTDLAAVFAVTGAGKGNLQASAGIGSQVIVTRNGTSTGAGPKCAVAAPVHKSSTGGDVAAVLAVAAVMLITLMAVAIISFRRWRTRRLARHGEGIYGR